MSGYRTARECSENYEGTRCGVRWRVNSMATTRHSSLKRLPSTLRGSLSLLVVFQTGWLQAQGSVVGSVLDGAQNPVRDAVVEVSGLRTQTDSLGRFALGQVAIGAQVLLVRKIGYSPKSENRGCTPSPPTAGSTRRRSEAYFARFTIRRFRAQEV